MRNIAFIGVGGVGGFFGGKMSQLLNDNKIDINIYFIARGKHLEKINSNGLILNTKDEGTFICNPTLATDNFDLLPTLDVCYICVKQYDLENVLKNLVTKINDNTIIIPLLNGIDIYDRIRKIITKGYIFPACVYVGTHIKQPGVIEQSGGQCTIIFGQDPNKHCTKVTSLCQLMDKAKIKYNYTEEYMKEIWSKYIFICAYGLVTASENKTLGEIIENHDLSEKVKKIMNEIISIGKCENINLPENILDISFNKAYNFPYNTKTSFQRDFEIPTKLDERALFGESLIKLSEKHNICIPNIKMTYERINTLMNKSFLV